MKRFAALILTLLYLSTSTGATIYTHYCMGKKAGWGWGNRSSNTCGNCGMGNGSDNNDGCCKDEHRFIKNTADQKAAESSFALSLSTGIALLPAHNEFAAVQFSPVAEKSPMSNAPPRSSGIPVYILNSIFLI